MSKSSLGKWLVAALALAFSVSVFANDEVRKLNENPNYWAFPGGNYWNWRYTELKQINTKNASNIVAAWTFSTGRPGKLEMGAGYANTGSTVLTPAALRLNHVVSLTEQLRQ